MLLLSMHMITRFYFFESKSVWLVTPYAPTFIYTRSKSMQITSAFAADVSLTAFVKVELEWCERKILLDWLELELVTGVV